MNNNITYDNFFSCKTPKLNIDCIYENRKPYKNKSDLILPKIMKVKNSGGFRPIGQYKRIFDVKYVVLYSTNTDVYWQDFLDEELGLYIYYGDNKQAGRELHNTSIGGNLILKNVFELTFSDVFIDRKKIPPFFLFEKTDDGDVKFSGLLVPGYKGVNQKDWLTAIWAKRNEGGRFQNYKAMFTVLDTSTGSDFSPNDASIDLRWLDDLKSGKGYESIYAPKVWKKWVEKGVYTPLTVKKDSLIRTKDEQLPSKKEHLEMLQYVHDYFINKPTNFEAFAISLTMLADTNIINCDNTRPSKDGGRDGIGEYRIMSRLSQSLKTSFAVEAKCYDLNNSVGVKETSRLISRIRHRQFGVFVTTSFVDKQAYKEIIEDEQPIAIISGIDIIEILYQNQITNLDELKSYLNNYFPKDMDI
jgi:hypothetical protein